MDKLKVLIAEDGLHIENATNKLQKYWRIHELICGHIEYVKII